MLKGSKRSKKAFVVERLPMVANRTAFVLGAATLLFGIVFFVVSVTGMLWPSTPVGDVGLLSVVSVTCLLGIGGLALSRYPAPEPPQN